MPKSKDKISVLGYGCMRLPTHAGGETSRFIDKSKAVQQIRGAIDAGVNYLDTAWIYHLGASESFLGEHVLTDGYREKVYIATKLPCMIISKKEKIEEIFNKQLEKLKVDYIDYYLLHSLKGSTWDKMLSLGIIEFMDKIKKEGKVRHMGFSFHGNHDDFVRIVDSYDWDFAQVQFNILDENYQAGIKGIEYASSKGLGIIIMEPLRGGSLVGKIPKEIKKNYDTAPIKRSAADWAFRWIYNHPEVTLVLSGMNVDEHIAENIKIASEALPNGLTDDEMSIIQRSRDIYLELMQVNCTGCGYCIPCPAGINIPNSFKNLNNYHMFGKLGAQFNHLTNSGVMTEDGRAHWTSACIDCGKCELVCPQGIKIREKFKYVQRDLEGSGVKFIAKIARWKKK
ncbi:MAG: aldo/keto reductase [Vulcanibacillus sp.]